MPAAVLHTAACDRLGVRHPIVQTAMGWIATPELTAATCNAGGFGILAVATVPLRQIDAAIRRVKELTDKPFGVNFLMEAPGADEIADLVIRHRVKAASYGRAPNAQFIAKFKAAGVLCMPTVGAVRHAQKAVQLGADIIIAQGGEGGGHTGSVPTSILVPQVVDAVKVPVLAAGGFRDGRGLVAALAYGAAGIAMGTRFLLSAESPIAPAAAERYFKATANDIFVTTDIDGLPQRVIRNEFIARLESRGKMARYLWAFRNALAYRRHSGASLRQLIGAALALQGSDDLTRTQALMAANAPMYTKRAVIDGQAADGVLPTGTVAALIGDRPPVEELIRGIMNQAEQTLAALAK